MSWHPRKGDWEALLDGELDLATRLRFGWHVRRCARCRVTRLAVVSDRARLAAALAACDPAPPDTHAAWTRVAARAAAPPRRQVPLRAALAAAAALAVVAGVAGHRLGRQAPPRTPTLAELRTLLLDRAVILAEDVPSPAALTMRLGDLERGGVVELRNTCCADHDGGGPADDGLLTVSARGQQVQVVLVYEDVDGNGVLSPGDVVRFVGDAEKVRTDARRPPVG